MKKKKLSYRHQIVAEMPLELLFGLIKVNELNSFVNNAVDGGDCGFLDTYRRYREEDMFNNKQDKNIFFFRGLFVFDWYQGYNYWWRKYWEMNI